MPCYPGPDIHGDVADVQYSPVVQSGQAVLPFGCKSSFSVRTEFVARAAGVTTDEKLPLIISRHSRISKIFMNGLGEAD